jgi:hypothetical protein
MRRTILGLTLGAMLVALGILGGLPATAQAAATVKNVTVDV